MIEIFVNAKFLSQNITGVQRFALEVVQALDKLLENNEFGEKVHITLLAPKLIKHQLTLKCLKLRHVGQLSGTLWEQVELPAYASGKLLINLGNTAPVFKINQILTIHDTGVYACPQSYSRLFKLWYKFLYLVLKRRAKKFITVSQFSKNEIMQFLGIDESQIFVVHEGCEHLAFKSPDYTILSRNDLEDKKYILVVSSISYHKNFVAVIKALELIENQEDIHVAIVGSTNNDVFSNCKFEKNEKVKQLGYVNDNELRALYESAVGFIYPSLYEGFGLPPLEAMSCGCPVIVSNKASLPEVCGNAALYCDPNDPSDIAARLKELINNKSLRAKLRDQGLERARLFTWHDCACKLLNIVQIKNENIKR